MLKCKNLEKRVDNIDEIELKYISAQNSVIPWGRFVLEWGMIMVLTKFDQRLTVIGKAPVSKNHMERWTCFWHIHDPWHRQLSANCYNNFFYFEEHFASTKDFWEIQLTLTDDKNTGTSSNAK